MSAAAAKKQTVLVIGSTGATGKHVVSQLLQKGHNVRTIARSKDRILSLLDDIVPNTSTTYSKNLQVVEAAILDLSDEDIQKQVDGVDAIVQCLGHNITFKGIYGKPRRLVTDAVKRLTSAIESTSSKQKIKFILMGSDGVSNPSGTDDQRSLTERFVISLLRALVPPHPDNEQAALYLHKNIGQTIPNLEWTVVRPTDLVDGTVGKYVLYDKPQGSLFGSGNVATRANVAQCMVDLLLADRLWKEQVYQMPVIHDVAIPAVETDAGAVTK